MNEMADIVKNVRENPNPDDAAWGATANAIATCIQKHTNLNGWVSIYKSKEVNAFATMAALLPTTPHSLRETTMMTKAMAKTCISQCKKHYMNMMTRRIEGRVDIQNSKVYGDFTKPTYLIQINTGVLLDERLTPRDSAFFIVHESGHIFNQISAVAETSAMAFQSAETFSVLMKAKPEGFKAILDMDARASDFKNTTVIREASEAQDAQTAFLVYIPKKVSEYMNAFSMRDPHGSYSSNSLELAADSFAIRHGGFKEFLRVRALFADHFTRRYYSVLVATQIVAVSTLKLALQQAIKYAALTAVATPGGLPFAILFGVLGTVFMTLITRVVGTPLKTYLKNDTVRMTNMGDYGEFIKRELAERAKEQNLSKDEIELFTDVLEEAREHIETSSAKDPIIVRFIDTLFNGSQSKNAIKDYANAVSSLMSNQLFIQAQMLGEETKS